MNAKIGSLFFLVVLPGFFASVTSVYYLLPEWAALEASYKHYRQVADSSSSTLNQLIVAKTAQEIHRINCFAEGVGLLLGGTIFAIGIHGICILTKKNSSSE